MSTLGRPCGSPQADLSNEGMVHLLVRNLKGTSRVEAGKGHKKMYLLQLVEKKLANICTYSIINPIIQSFTDIKGLHRSKLYTLEIVCNFIASSLVRL